MADENIFFMRVDEPVEVRKQLLESARVCVHGLQRYERFKELRNQKVHRITQLRHSIAELNKLIVKLREVLPDATPAAPVEELGKVLRKDTKEKREVHPPHENPDKAIAKLHHQLKAIEHKLNALA